MLEAHNGNVCASARDRQVAEIDKQIEKNKARIAQIEKELVAQGVSVPTAPQVNLTPQNPFALPGLQKEKDDLQAKNRELEAKKQTLWQDVEARARRAGIPPGYIRR